MRNRILMKLFGSRREGATGNRRQLNGEEIYDLYSAPNGGRQDIIKVNLRVVRWEGVCVVLWLRIRRGGGRF